MPGMEIRPITLQIMYVMSEPSWEQDWAARRVGLALPHLVYGWHQGETQRFDRERTTCLKARCTKREKRFRLVGVFPETVHGISNASSVVGGCNSEN